MFFIYECLSSELLHVIDISTPELCELLISPHYRYCPSLLCLYIVTFFEEVKFSVQFEFSLLRVSWAWLSSHPVLIGCYLRLFI